MPLGSSGSLSMNRALMVAGHVDRIQLTAFPVITGQTGDDPIFLGAADFDLELIDGPTLDGNIQELGLPADPACVNAYLGPDRRGIGN